MAVGGSIPSSRTSAAAPIVGAGGAQEYGVATGNPVPGHSPGNRFPSTMHDSAKQVGQSTGRSLGSRSARAGRHGGLAHLVEHLVCNQKVTGSTPVSSTGTSVPVSSNTATRGCTAFDRGY